jgi:hypothetical protein
MRSIKRVITFVVLLAIAGWLVFGGVHRTQSVLASESHGTGKGGAGTVQTQGIESQSGHRHGTGRGAGGGLDGGSGYTE